VIVRSSSSGGGPDAVRTTVTRTSAATTVSVTGGRVDGVAATTATTDSSIVLAVAVGDDTELIEIDTDTGKEHHRARIKRMTASLGLTPTPSGWLLYTEHTVTHVNLTTGRTADFDLPGPLLGP
jgi:hypothetical protein